VIVDPYRTLGLTPGVPLDEVKRAYRVLAKRFHPDAAGEGATERFLAIQAAYEAIVTGGRPTGRARSGPRRPSAADPERARATREAYRARSRRTSTGPTAGPEPRPDDRTSTRRSAGPEPRPDDRSGPADRRTGRGATSDGRRSRRTGSSDGQDPSRPSGGRTKRAGSRRKATLNSTSYDEVKEPFEPGWSGGSWYGPSSGTYWTINPREYADPRKHGPEYQARARRAAGAEAGASDATTAERSGGATRDGQAGASRRGPVSSADARPADARSAGTRPAGTADPAPGRSVPFGSATADGDRPAARAATGASPIGPTPAAGSSAPGGVVVTAALLGFVIALVPAAILFLGSGPSGNTGLVLTGLSLPLIGAFLGAVAGLLSDRARPT